MLTGAFTEIPVTKHFSGKTVIQVQSPVTKEYYNTYLNNSEIDDYFKSLGKYYNFKFIDIMRGAGKQIDINTCTGKYITDFLQNTVNIKKSINE